MTDVTPEERRRRLKVTFDAFAPKYDALRFLRLPAERLVELAMLSSGASVLDVATGTGNGVLRLAERVGDSGAVVGIDLSTEMLHQARQKLAAADFRNVELREGDAERLDFPDRSFDAVLCASSLFFLSDMAAALQEWRRVLVPGGLVGVSAFGPAFLQPLRRLWKARLAQHGLMVGTLPSDRVSDPGTAGNLLREAGFTRVDVWIEQLGYHVPAPDDRWQDILVGLEGRPLLQLSATEREQVRSEHLAELKMVTTTEGLWVDVPVLFAFGRRQTG